MDTVSDKLPKTIAFIQSQCNSLKEFQQRLFWHLHFVSTNKVLDVSNRVRSRIISTLKDILKELVLLQLTLPSKVLCENNFSDKSISPPTVDQNSGGYATTLFYYLVQTRFDAVTL
jgi:hypothetical protein